jgi:hypothetical protein
MAENHTGIFFLKEIKNINTDIYYENKTIL